MTNFAHMPTHSATLALVAPLHISVGGAHGRIQVRWLSKSATHWEVVPDPDLPTEVVADWGPSLGDISFDPTAERCLIRLTSRHGHTWTMTDRATSPADARSKWLAHAEQASFNPMWVDGFDRPTAHGVGPDDMTLKLRPRHDYLLEWGDRIGSAINDYQREFVARGAATRSPSHRSKGACEAEKRLVWCCDEVHGHRLRGTIQRGSLEGDRVCDLHTYASGLLAASAPPRSAIASSPPTTANANRAVV